MNICESFIHINFGKISTSMEGMFLLFSRTPALGPPEASNPYSRNRPPLIEQLRWSANLEIPH